MKGYVFFLMDRYIAKILFPLNILRILLRNNLAMRLVLVYNKVNICFRGSIKWQSHITNFGSC